MAKIIKKASGLEQEYFENSTRAKEMDKKSGKWLLGVALGFALMVLGVVLLALDTDNRLITAILLGAGLLSIIISSICAHYYGAASFEKNSNNSVLGAGNQGENATANIVSALPNSFVGFQNVVVTFEGQKSEMDMVVVGPTGVYIIETKNHNGTIYGGYADRNWIQHKIGRRGSPYQNEIYSPVKQVGTHIYRLANYLRSNGARVHVDGLVYFSNYEAVLQLHGKPDKIPVFSASGNDFASINRYIVSGDITLDNATVNKVYNLLNRAH